MGRLGVRDSAAFGGGLLMLLRRAILGAVALVLAILVTQLSRVSTSAEDKGESPARSDNQLESDVRAQTEGPGEPQADEETVEIPLREIWAHNMPGTKQVVHWQRKSLA